MTTDGAGSWTDGAGNWNDGVTDANWNNATPDSAVIGSNNPAGSYAIALGSGITTGGITFNAGTTYTVTGNTLTLSATPTISVAPATTATISSILAGTGFNKDGTGTLIVGGTAASTYTGLVTVNNGTLAVAGTVGDGSIRGSVTVNSGATLLLNASDRIINTSLITVQSGGTFNRNGLSDVVGSISGGGAIIGTGTLTLDMISGSTHTFSGPISGGALVLRGSNNSGAVNSRLILTGANNLTTNNINVHRGASSTGTVTLEFGGAGSTTAGTLNIGNSGTGQARVEVTGSHALTLSNVSIGEAAGSHPGFLTHNSTGTMAVSGLFRIGHWPGSGTYSISSGTLNLTGTPAGVVNQAVAGEQNGVLYIGVDGTGTVLQSGGTITANSMVLDARGNTGGTDTYTMTGGTLRLGANGIRTGSLDANTTYAINLGAGTVQSTAAWTVATPMNMTLTSAAPGTTFDSSGGNFTLSGALSGVGGLNKAGANTLILSGANTFAGNTTINASSGVLQVGAGGATGAVGGAVSVGASSTLRLFRNDTYTFPNNISGSGTLYIGSTTAAPETDYANLTGNNSGFTGPITINMGGIQINDSNGLGTGTKTVTMNNGTAGNPFLRLNGGGGNITLASGISFLTSTSSNQGSIVNVAGDNVINGAVSMTAGGGDTVLNSLAGSLTMNGNMTFTSGARVVRLIGAGNGTVSGVISRGATTLVGVQKQGAGIWTLGNAANNYDGTTHIQGGLLVVSSGNEQTLGDNPGVFSAGHLTLNGGGLGISGSSLTINDSNRGITIGALGGTFQADPGLTLTVANAVSGGSGSLNKAGNGTVDLTGGATLGSFNVGAGTLRQSAGTVTAANPSTIQSGATYRLAGGKLRVDNLTIAGDFDWGSGGALTHYSTIGSSGGDNSSTGFQTVGVGTTLNVIGNLSTGNGAVLALHASPTLYEQLGIRFNNLAITGDFSLNGVGDVLEFELNPYLLRPFSTTGTAAIEFGSLPLITWTGTDPAGTFDSVTGITNDGRGFALSTFAVSTGSALDVNTYFLEYDNANNTLWFHYKVNGYVPEPGTFGLLAAGTLFIRLFRRAREQQARLVSADG